MWFASVDIKHTWFLPGKIVICIKEYSNSIIKVPEYEYIDMKTNYRSISQHVVDKLQTIKIKRTYGPRPHLKINWCLDYVMKNKKKSQTD